MNSIEGIIVERMRLGDEARAVYAVEQVKRASANSSRMREFLDSDVRALLIAYDGEKPVGFALAYELARIDDKPPMFFFYEIEVLPSYQRRGIGAELVASLKEIGRERQTGKMFVLTDRRNEAARALYRGTGGTEEYDDGILFVYDRTCYHSGRRESI